MMDFVLEGLLLGLLFLGGMVIVRVLIPARELLTELRRIAAGDYRPVIMGEIPFLLKKTAQDLRLVAESLARQQALLAEEEFSLSMILGRMTEGVVIAGPDLRVRLMNEAASAMLHLEKPAKGLLLQEIFLSHELQGVAQQALSSGEVQRGELSLTMPGHRERYHLVVTAAPLQASETKSPDGLLLVLHDVTRMRKLESVRREFVANVSHEFRTPLSIINGYLETLEDDQIDREMFRKSISVMRRHGDRLNDLIEDRLTISRMEEKGVLLEVEPADILPILKHVIAQMDYEISTRMVTLKLETHGPLPLVEVDAYRLEQAFSNLLANALRHGRSPGGEIAIAVTLQGAELMISFRDNGPGIPYKDQAHIFERFYRVGGDRARHTGGTGLGLSIVKHVVQAHGGRIVLESKPGAGANFKIFLPAALLPGIS
jgi:two-component system, OmpR family, phosphate regulon sensor histidine kinase PhoR